MGNLYKVLKVRKVLYVAAWCAVVIWMFVQVANAVLSSPPMSEWTISIVSALFILGFVMTVMLVSPHEALPSALVLEMLRKLGFKKSRENEK